MYSVQLTPLPPTAISGCNNVYSDQLTDSCAACQWYWVLRFAPFGRCTPIVTIVSRVSNADGTPSRLLGGLHDTILLLPYMALT